MDFGIINKDSKKINNDACWSGEVDDKIIDYYCPDCGATYSERVRVDFRSTSDKITSNTHTWYKCDCGSDAYEIDHRILTVILKLNKIGFKTAFCCEGHNFNEAAYISFDPSVNLDGIELPYLWVRDKSQMVEVIDAGHKEDIQLINQEIIRTTLFDDPDKLCRIFGNDFEHFKNIYLNSLYVWVDELETIVLEKRVKERVEKMSREACQTSSKATDYETLTVCNMFDDTRKEE